MLKLSEISRRQILTLISFGIADFCVAVCFSLQAPFYPQEAEKKGATAAEYGLVFGVFELTCFISSPLYGKFIHRIGPKVLFNTGLLTAAISSIVFGFLDRIDGHYPFIISCLIVRIIEALGNAGFFIATFTLIATEFPENVATTFASLETFFGLGMIVGPTLGGALYQLGGYTTPFVVLGLVLFLAAFLTHFVLPDYTDVKTPRTPGVSLLKMLKIPGVMLASAGIVTTAMSIGFLSATLEPHLRQFGLTPIALGAMFIINGGMYALTASFWGWLCDKKVDPKVVSLIGCLFLVVGFSLIGPVPFIPSPKTGSPEKLTLVIVGLVIHGISIGCQLVASFTGAMKTSMANGFPDNVETYGLISGLWSSSFAFGCFIGPTIGGILYDSVGFNSATLFIVVIGTVLTILNVIIIYYDRRTQRILHSEETSQMLPTTSESSSVNKHLFGVSYGSTDVKSSETSS